MSESCELQPTVVRNERGLSINGTRVTLYHIMDHLRAGSSAEELREWFPVLSERQIEDALAYIEAHQAEVDAEYEFVVAKAEENRRYWEERNRERFEQIAAMPPRPELVAFRARRAAAEANGSEP